MLTQGPPRWGHFCRSRAFTVELVTDWIGVCVWMALTVCIERSSEVHYSRMISLSPGQQSNVHDEHKR